MSATGPASPTRWAARAGDDRRDVNSATVLRTVLDHGPVARSRVAALSGLSPAAVSRQVVDLLAYGLLCERPELAGTGSVGRPQLPVDVDTERLAVAGVHVGVPYSTLSLLDLRGNVLAQEVLDNLGLTGRAVLDRLLGQVPGFLAEAAAGREVVGLGAITGGAVDPERGVTVRHEPLDWYEVPLGRLLERASGLPVRVDNHARALAQAEILFGRPAARRSLVQLFVGHVVDVALAVGGLVHLGPRSATGEVAHLRVPGSTADCPCGRRGCLAAAASDTTLYRDAVTAGVIPVPERTGMIAAVRAGDARADRLVLRRARLIGQAVAVLVDVVNPDLVVLTETFAMLDGRYLEAVRAEVARRSYLGRDPELVVTPQGGRDALAVAAGAAVLGELFRSPLSCRRRPAPAAG
ncbi:ROK family protein [Kitasatospora sp. NPDC051170]|uniref:ROK family transcriptional regulator n=1 Tax=Kitasatospora sp. NPDC051170 TaxID=3364056 RepID=UPI00379A1AF5